MTTYRKIIHVDMDAFYASVEQRDHPELRGKPIAVGHAGSRGVVATASYEARRFGVHSAMPSAQAKEKCPQLIFVHSNMAHYREVSSQVREIFHRYTDLIEPISIDEAYLDVTNNKIGAELAVDIAKAIKKAIREELHLTASAGVSYNKFLAKVASDYRKPDGLCVVHPDQALAFIDRLPIEAFWGVGPATAKKMHSLGIHSAPELRRQSLSFLTEHFGKAGLIYYNFVRGIDTHIRIQNVQIPPRIRQRPVNGNHIRHLMLGDTLRLRGGHPPSPIVLIAFPVDQLDQFAILRQAAPKNLFPTLVFR